MTTSETDLLPRALFMDGEAFSAPAISPNGSRVAYLAPFHGARNLWIADPEDITGATPLTTDTVSSIREFYWAQNDAHLILIRDPAGSEQTQIESLAITTGESTIMGEWKDAQCRLVAIGPGRPDEILIESNARDSAYFDIYCANLWTGATELVFRNDRFSWIYADHFLKPRLGEMRRDDGSVTYFASTDGKAWHALIDVPAADEMVTRPFRIFETTIAFDAEATEIYAMDCRGRDTAALAAWNLETGEARVLESDPQADICAIHVNPANHEVLAVVSEYLRPETRGLQPATAADLQTLSANASAHETMGVISVARDNRRWLVGYNSPSSSTRFALYNHATRRAIPLYSNRPELEGVSLGTMTPYLIRSHDGLDLVSYLTMPPGTETGARLPLVALIHGGPWQRSSYDFDPWVQFLASRGYAVLTVNFRGSRGFGKAFLNAGDRQWGYGIIDDIIGTVRHFIANGIADPDRISVMGASFGGYASLMSVARAPELFRCCIDMFGVTNLESFLNTIPPYWKAMAALWRNRVGDWSSEAGRAELGAQSPLHHVEGIRCPVLIAQGGNDPRVVQAESDQLAKQLAAHGSEIAYLLFPDEGHGFYQQTNETAFFAAVETFLAGYLGGAAEPPGPALTQSSLTVVRGGDFLPGFDT